jgi:hypothetical protein
MSRFTDALTCRGAPGCPCTFEEGAPHGSCPPRVVCAPS